MSTKNKWLIGIGVVLLLAVMYALPFVLQSTVPAYGCGLWHDGRRRWHDGRRHDGGNTASVGIRPHWLIPLALLTLIGLGIAALIKYLRSA